VGAPTTILLFALALGLALLAAAAPPCLADFATGAAAYEKGDYAAALAEWTAMANAGDARSQLGLGVLCESGHGLPAPDLPQAVVWYRAAAAQGSAAAQNNLALLYARGRGVPLNPVMAGELWHVAAAAGYPLAQFNLALAYEQGFGVPRDYDSAARWYAEAGNRGVGDAAFALSELYRTGRGVPQHDELAKLWLAVARKFGSTLAVRKDFTAATPTGKPVAAKAEPAKSETPKQQVAAKPAQTKQPESSPPQSAAAKPAESKPTPTQSVATKPAESKPTQATSASATTTPAKAAADPAGGFVLQLASLPSQAEAERAGDALKARYADILGKLDLTIHRADLGASKGVWYRVFAGPLGEHDAATRLCERLRAAPHPADCFVLAVK
jgi:cell division septation protein DedD